jgi:hypothetical protein
MRGRRQPQHCEQQQQLGQQALAARVKRRHGAWLSGWRLVSSRLWRAAVNSQQQLLLQQGQYIGMAAPR